MVLDLTEDRADATVPPPQQPGPLNRMALLIFLGVFATGLAQPNGLGNLAFSHFLEFTLHLKRTAFSAFFGIMLIPWLLKPLAGVLSDAFPIFGTKRRHYVLICTALAALAWLVLPMLRRSYWPLATFGLVINIFLATASTAIGGALIEMGRTAKTIGRLTAARVAAQSFVELTQGPIGGLLVRSGFGLLSVTGSLLIGGFFPVAYICLKEPVRQNRNRKAFRQAAAQLRLLVTTKSAVIAMLAIALFFFAPGFGTPLYFQQKTLFSLTDPQLGFLRGIGGACGIAAAIAYGTACRRWPLNKLITVAVCVNAAANFMYLLYSKSIAVDAIIEGQNGLFSTMCILVLYDLAARSVPAGSEAMAYGLFISLATLCWRLSDLMGSALSDKGLAFGKLVAINSLSTLVVIWVISFLPKAIREATDGTAPSLR